MRLLSMIDASLTRDFGANKLWRWQWDLPSRQRKFYSLNIGNIKMWKITNSSWRTIHHVKLRRSQRISRDIVDWLRLAEMEGETRILNANPNDKCLSNQFWKSYRSARSLGVGVVVEVTSLVNRIILNCLTNRISDWINEFFRKMFIKEQNDFHQSQFDESFRISKWPHPVRSPQ